MAYAVTVVTAHFFFIPFHDPAYRAKLVKILIQDWMLYDMVQDFYGKQPIQVTPSNHLVNAYKTTKSIHKGLQWDDTKKIGIVSQADVADKDTLSICHREDKSHFNGFRIKRIMHTNATRDVAPPVITVKVTKLEMPDHSIYHVWIQGMCRGGGSL